MIDQKPRKTTRQPNHKQLLQLTRLKLEQLEKVAGGPEHPACLACLVDE